MDASGVDRSSQNALLGETISTVISGHMTSQEEAIGMNKPQLGAMVLLFLLASGMALGVGNAANTTIDKMMMDENYGEKLFISTSTTVFDRPQCSNHPAWEFVLDTSTPLGIQMYAILVKHYADQTPVSLRGNGTCDVFTGIETLRRVDLL